jgi:hypothetical protein
LGKPETTGAANFKFLSDMPQAHRRNFNFEAVGQLQKLLLTVCPVRGLFAACRANQNMCSAPSGRKLGKHDASVTIAWLAARPIPSAACPTSLVNSRRFDKAASGGFVRLLGF